MKIDYQRLESPIGPLALFARGSTLLALEFLGAAEHPAESEPARRLAARIGPFDLERKDRLPGISDALAAYFAGDPRAIESIAVDTGGTVFQQKVWKELRRIDPARPISYAELARRVGSPKAVRAVGAANGRNPIAIVVP
ncbi:MAG: methylated-DNA--[protein]-cysteine S-methyltransferase, partial [Candidatus Eisenbacteria bacterium]|nr:methylated-DNA--[protein]-cysteine S-methyltransferase [Candidatus Eisenbacteria bacterium]